MKAIRNLVWMVAMVAFMLGMVTDGWGASVTVLPKGPISLLSASTATNSSAIEVAGLGEHRIRFSSVSSNGTTNILWYVQGVANRDGSGTFTNISTNVYSNNVVVELKWTNTESKWIRLWLTNTNSGTFVGTNTATYWGQQAIPASLQSNIVSGQVVGGRDVNGVARPVKVGTDGAVYVAGVTLEGGTVNADGQITTNLLLEIKTNQLAIIALQQNNSNELAAIRQGLSNGTSLMMIGSAAQSHIGLSNMPPSAYTFPFVGLSEAVTNLSYGIAGGSNVLVFPGVTNPVNCYAITWAAPSNVAHVFDLLFTKLPITWPAPDVPNGTNDIPRLTYADMSVDKGLVTISLGTNNAFGNQKIGQTNCCLTLWGTTYVYRVHRNAYTNPPSPDNTNQLTIHYYPNL